MSKRGVVILTLVVLFLIAVSGMLWREIAREEEKLAKSISGRADVSMALARSGLANFRREDRAAFILVDPATREPVAMRMIAPFLPPAVFDIGQENARGELSGSYLLVVITDKDGEIFRPTPGESYGISPNPIALGAKQVIFEVQEAFQGGLFNKAAGGAPMAGGQGGRMGGADGPPELSVSGRIDVAANLAATVKPTDRLIILLFDPQTGRPAANKIVSGAAMPRNFSISVSPEAARSNGGKGYFLRVVTDNNGNPFGSAPGEVAGRSKEAIPLGTAGLEFTLDQPYKR